MNKLNGDYLVRFILTVVVVFALGCLFGVRIEQRNVKTIKDARISQVDALLEAR